MGGGGSPLQVRYEKWVGGGEGRGGILLQVRYEKWGGGGQFASGPIGKVGGGGGGGAIRFRSDTKSGGGGDTFVWHKENTLSLIVINSYNFDQGGAEALHTRARMSLIVVLNFIHSLIVFILETEGGARTP